MGTASCPFCWVFNPVYSPSPGFVSLHLRLVYVVHARTCDCRRDTPRIPAHICPRACLSCCPTLAKVVLPFEELTLQHPRSQPVVLGALGTPDPECLHFRSSVMWDPGLAAPIQAFTLRGRPTFFKLLSLLARACCFADNAALFSGPSERSLFSFCFRWFYPMCQEVS